VYYYLLLIIIIKQTLKARINRKRTSQMHLADVAAEKIVFIYQVYVSERAVS